MLNAFILLGGGHGISTPIALFFSPIALLVPLGDSSPTATIIVTIIILITGPFLYSLYAVVLAFAKQRGSELLTLWLVLAAHYLCFAIWLTLMHEDDIEHFSTIWSIMWFLVVASAGAYIGAHVLAFRFVLKNRKKVPLKVPA